MQQREAPVFFDQSGKRWIIVENCIIILVALVGVLAHWLGPMVLEQRLPPNLSATPTERPSSVEVVAAGDHMPSVNHLTSILGSQNTAVVGSGPLVRLVKIEKSTDGTYFEDPFSQEVLKKLTDQETQYINGDDYAIQRYGNTGNKQLFLTFDDGPDEIFTPRLLDVLSRESVPATFFVTGSNVAQYPEIAKRIVNEGHSIANHTFSHIDFDFVGNFRGEQEINQTQRLIVAATGRETALFRPPYGGSTDQSLRNSLKSILTAQRLGYTVVSYDFDSDDWHFPAGIKPVYPTLDDKSSVILLHDGGGNREQTIAYVEELIRQAKNQGYGFASLGNIYPQAPGNPATTATLADHASLVSAQAVLVWPRLLVRWLFVFSIGSLIAMTLLNILLAILFKARTRYSPRSKKYQPHVTIILPAYNEEKVIEKSIRSLLRSRYRKMKIVIIDDGSTDQTWKIAKSLAKRYKRVRAIHQTNGGKASALNNAIAKSKSDIVICVDADTILPPQTIMNLIRHFEDETVGAVAGVVKVGNPNSMLTKWQAIEYASGIGIERNAQAVLKAIMIVPGACSAWRRSVLVETGGFSSSTLAEDCDLALKIQETKQYRILQDNQAVSYTEAPQLITALTKQRFRWTFGNIQSLWKHRSMIFNMRYGWLGMYVMPSIVISIIVPILFWPLLITLTVINLTSGNYLMILQYFLLSLLLQFIVAAIGITLSREKFSYLLAVPFGRVTYGPIRMYILYKTILTILKGVDVGWNKLARTGTVYDPLSTGRSSRKLIQKT